MYKRRGQQQRVQTPTETTRRQHKQNDNKQHTNSNTGALSLDQKLKTDSNCRRGVTTERHACLHHMGRRTVHPLLVTAPSCCHPPPSSKGRNHWRTEGPPNRMGTKSEGSTLITASRTTSISLEADIDTFKSTSGLHEPPPYVLCGGGIHIGGTVSNHGRT